MFELSKSLIPIIQIMIIMNAYIPTNLCEKVIKDLSRWETSKFELLKIAAVVLGKFLCHLIYYSNEMQKVK